MARRRAFPGGSTKHSPQRVPSGLVTMANVTVSEADGTATFTPTLSSVQDRAVRFDYATESDTAVAGSDYTAVSGTKTIAAGQLTTTITVEILDDAVQEVSESLNVRLSNIRYV